MILSQAIHPFLNMGFTEKEIVDIMANAGFTGIDFSFYANNFSLEKTDETEYFSNFKKLANDRGLFFNQAHAPMPTDNGDPQALKDYFERITNGMKKAAMLGIGTIIVHPSQHLNCLQEGSQEKLFEFNIDMYKRLKPYCEEYGIKVALENMYQRSDGINLGPSICSTPKTFIQYLDELDKNWFTACLDIGHAQLVGESIPDFIRALGPERLTALHIHDVMPNSDLHAAPFCRVGTVDFDMLCSSLKEIGYKGDFTFETVYQYKRVPKELYPSLTKYIADIGKYLISKIEN